MNTTLASSDNSVGILSQLLFSPTPAEQPSLLRLSRAQFDELAALASSHHVVIRALETLRGIMADAGDSERYGWAADALRLERARIDRAVESLRDICAALASEGCAVTVIKSLDHWPDLGSDLDLYTSADPAEVISVMTGRLDARIADRSWGDRLANKWNFILPALPELVEVHVARLGQTGELAEFAGSLPARARAVNIGNYVFSVPAAEDRLMICTLQRMYRHFYIRLCDIADTAQLLETHSVDYEELCDSAQESGIWEGVATFLKIVSDYVHRWRGREVALPASVRSAAQFGENQIRFSRGFLRVPILPHSARLYASEWTALMWQGRFENVARLSLLPCLATAAALGQKITGSDKGIW